MAQRELTDAEVFGAAQPARELTDAEVFGAQPAKAEASARKRSLGERFLENVDDAAMRNPTIAGLRAAYSNPLEALPMQPLSVRPGGGMPRPPSLLDTNPIGQGVMLGLGIKGMMDRAAGREDPRLSAKVERKRREDYEARSKADPFYEAPGGVGGKTAAGAVTLGGQVLGSMTDPENLVSPGKTVVGRIAGNVGVNAAADVQSQGADLRSGVQDRYNPVQTAASAGAGLVIGGAVESAGPLARGLRDRLPSKRPERAPFELSDDDVFGRGPAEPAAHPKEFTDAEVFSETPRAPTAAPQPKRPRAPAFDEAQARATVSEVLPGATVTSGRRTAEHNAKVGGAAKSYHLSGHALDIVPPKGADLAKFRADLQARGVDIAELLDEGDHWHVAWRGAKGPGAVAPGATVPRPAPEPDFLRGVPEQSLDDIPTSEPTAWQDVAAFDAGQRGSQEALPNHTGTESAGAAPESLPNTLPAVTAAPGVVAAPSAPAGGLERGDLWRMSREDLQAAHEHEQAREADGLVQALGSPEAVAEFKRLDRARNDQWSVQKADEAQAEFDRRYGDMTPEQERLIYGTGETHASADDIRELLRAHDDATDLPGMSEDELIHAAGSAIKGVRPSELKKVLAGGSQPYEQARAAQLMTVVQEMQGRGLRLDGPTLGRVVNSLVERGYGKHSDVAEIVGGFFDEVARSGSALRLGGDANPIPKVAAQRALPAPEASPARDLTDDALDLLRSGRRARVDNGPTLIEHLARSGGLADNAGELKNIGAERWHTDKAFRSKLVRDGGRALDDAAVAAQEAGYLRERVGGDADTRATPQDLLDAIREEMAGRPRYARNDEAGAELRQHAEDVDEMLNVLGIDPKGMSNAQIKAEIDAYFRGTAAPEPAGTGRAMASERLGMAPRAPGRPTPRRMSPATEARLRKRHAIDLSKYQGQISAAAPSASRNVGGLRDAPRPGDVPTVPDGKSYTGPTVSQLAAKLRSALGITHRQGRLTLKGGAVGEFDPRSSVIRTKAVAELDVLAHEATHALQAKAGPALKAALKAHATEVGGLAYPGANPKHIQEEGFAEFGRWYLTNPAHAQKIAPKFYAAFEAAMQQDAARIAADLKGIQTAYQAYLSAPSLETAAASVALTGKPGPLEGMRKALADQGIGGVMRDVMDQAYTAFIDDLHPVGMAVKALQDLHLKNTGQHLELNVAKNPYALARLSREAYASGHIDLMDGVVPYKGTDPDGPSLSQALELALGTRTVGKWAKNDLRTFDAYLIARRMVHEWDRYAAGDLKNPPDRTSKEYHEGVIRDAEKLHDTFRPAAAIVYDWLTALWKKEHAAGLITGETYLKGLTAHPDYVPLMRDMSDKGGFRAGKPRGAMQFAGGSKEFKGSTRDVISPLSSMMRRAYELNAIIKRNDVMKALDDLGEVAGPGSGSIVERLPRHEVEAINVDAVDALSKAAEAAGLSERDITTLVHAAETALDGQSQATIFKRREMNPSKGEAVVFVWRDGKKTPLLLPDGEFGQAMFTSLAGMNHELQSGVVDAMAAGTQLLRYGVTLSPEFMARNFVRDQLATWINTDVGFTPIVSSIKGAVSEVRQDAHARRYGIAGGMRGGPNTAATRKPFPKTDAQAEAQLQHLRNKGYRVRRYASWRGLAELTDLSETSTRLGVFGAAFKQAKKRGLDDYESMLEAAFTSRDYMDFGRRGSRMLSAVRVVTFLNASLQSLDKTARVLSADGNLRKVLAPFGGNAPKTDTEKRALAHAYKAWAKVSALGVLGLGLRMLYADDPEYEEISDQLRATHWILKVQGRWTFIPKPFELATISNILERAYEAGGLKDPTAAKRLLSDMSNTIAPPHEIPSMAVPFAIAKNRDYRGAPIVPEHLRGTVDPEYQFNSFTSELGEMIGRTLHVSPAVVDYVITGFGGSLGRYALQGTNLVAEKATGKPAMASGPEDYFLSRAFIRDVSRGSTSQKEFWDEVSKSGGRLTTAEGTFRQLVRAGDNAKALEYLNDLEPRERAYVKDKVLRPAMAKFHPMDRAQKALAVITDVRRDAREGTLAGANGRPIKLTPSQRREVDDALSHLAMSEMRNALIATGAKGWAQKRYMPNSDSMERLAEAAPPVPAALKREMALAGVPTIGAVNQVWNSSRTRLERPADPREAGALIDARRLKSSDKGERIKAARSISARPTARASSNPFATTSAARGSEAPAPDRRNAFAKPKEPKAMVRNIFAREN